MLMLIPKLEKNMAIFVIHKHSQNIKTQGANLTC